MGNSNTPVVTFPADAYVYTAADELDTTAAPVENGTGDQTDGMGAL